MPLETIASAPETTVTEPVLLKVAASINPVPVPALMASVPALFKVPGPAFKIVVFPSSVSRPLDMLLNVPEPFKIVPEATVALPELTIVQPVKTIAAVPSIESVAADGIESVPEPLK